MIKIKQGKRLIVMERPENAPGLDFDSYYEIKVGKTNMVTGFWSSASTLYPRSLHRYQDRLGYLPCRCELIRRTNKRLYFKIIQ